MSTMLKTRINRKHLPVLFAMAALPGSAMAAAAEVTIDTTLPTAPTGLLFHKGAFYGGAVTGVNEYGTIYQLVQPSKTNPKWSVNILCVFGDFQGDGDYPIAALTFDKAGNLYGTTYSGGTGSTRGSSGNGTIFKLSPPASSANHWSKQIIYAFPTPVMPQAKLAMDDAGNLYLPTGESVLQFTPPASGSGSYTMSAIPIPSGYKTTASGVVIDRFGNLFGVSQTIATSPSASDIIYELTPPTTTGAQWSSHTLQSFPSTAQVGQLGISPSGHLFGTTSPVGSLCNTSNCAVFELVPEGHGAWTEQIVHSFANDPLGSPPSATGSPYVPNDYQLSFAAGGVIYGAIIQSQAKSGANSTIYRLTPPASGQTTWTETALYTFQGGFLAGTPLYIAENGTVYGTAYGGQEENGFLQSMAFKITPP